MTDYRNILDRVGIQLRASGEPAAEGLVPGRVVQGLFAPQDAIPDRQAEYIALLGCGRGRGAVADGESKFECAGVVSFRQDSAKQEPLEVIRGIPRLEPWGEGV